jgi:hypothetical protein
VNESAPDPSTSEAYQLRDCFRTELETLYKVGLGAHVEGTTLPQLKAFARYWRKTSSGTTSLPAIELEDLIKTAIERMGDQKRKAAAPKLLGITVAGGLTERGDAAAKDLGSAGWDSLRHSEKPRDLLDDLTTRLVALAEESGYLKSPTSTQIKEADYETASGAAATALETDLTSDQEPEQASQDTRTSDASVSSRSDHLLHPEHSIERVRTRKSRQVRRYIFGLAFLAAGCVTAAILLMGSHPEPPRRASPVSYSPANRKTFNYLLFNPRLSCHDPRNPGVLFSGRCGSLNGPVFDSFINTPEYGDERVFLEGRREGESQYANPVTEVIHNHEEIILRVYVDNDANPETNKDGLGVAHGTWVDVELPHNSSTNLTVTASIGAANATTVTDSLVLSDHKPFTLTYVPESAVLYNRGPFQSGVHLPDRLLESNPLDPGTPIGYSSFNGLIPGGFEYQSYIELDLAITPENPT